MMGFFNFTLWLGGIASATVVALMPAIHLFEHIGTAVIVHG